MSNPTDPKPRSPWRELHEAAYAFHDAGWDSSNWARLSRVLAATDPNAIDELVEAATNALRWIDARTGREDYDRIGEPLRTALRRVKGEE